MKQAYQLIALLFCLWCIPTQAQTPEEFKAIDQYIEEQMAKQRIPGLSLAIVRNGEAVKLSAYGLANVELKVSVTPDTVFQSGSVGKQFTAAAVLLLNEVGKLKLDDPVTQYFDKMPESWRTITIRHLLSHTSGIKNLLPPALDYRRDYTDEELLQKAMSAPLDFAPGEQWRYSNTGYIVLGLLIKKVTGQFYGEVLRERIFVPLKMETARTINEPDIIPNRAAGYCLDTQRQLKNQTYVAPTLNQTADGALYLTIRDMVKWSIALDEAKLLNAESRTAWWSPIKLTNGQSYPYGFGWFLNEVNGHPLLEHSGGWQGFSAHIARYPQDKLTVIVMANQVLTSSSAIAHGVAERLVPALKRIAIQLETALLDAYVGQYELAPNVTMSVSREADKLFLQMPGQPRRELSAEAENRFFMSGVDAQFVFVRQAGQVTHLSIQQFGTNTDAKKFK